VGVHGGKGVSGICSGTPKPAIVRGWGATKEVLV
jgi:hypothetical protein